MSIDFAIDRIEALEEENARLENENVELRKNLKGAKNLVDALGQKHDYWMNRCKDIEEKLRETERELEDTNYQICDMNALDGD